MNIVKPNYYLQISLAALILSLTFVGQTRAEPTVRLADGATTVQLSADLVGALTGLGVTPAATGPATLSEDGIATFPIVAGAIDLETNIGDIFHSGGLSLSGADGNTVDLFNFIIDNTPGKMGSDDSAKDPAAANTTVQPANNDKDAGNMGTNATDTDPAATNTATPPVDNNDASTGKKTTLTGLAALNDDLAGRLPLFNLDFKNAVVETNGAEGEGDNDTNTDTSNITDINVTGVEMSLTKEAAEALNAAFNVTAFTENLIVGTANVEGLVDTTNDIGDEADDVADEAEDVADDVADEADDVADEVGL